MSLLERTVVVLLAMAVIVGVDWWRHPDEIRSLWNPLRRSVGAGGALAVVAAGTVTFIFLVDEIPPRGTSEFAERWLARKLVITAALAVGAVAFVCVKLLRGHRRRGAS